MNDFCVVALDEVAGPEDRRLCRPCDRSRRSTCLTREPRCQPHHNVVHDQVAWLFAQIEKNLCQCLPEPDFGNDRIGNEWKGVTVTVDGANQVGRQIDHPIDQPILGTCGAIMQLIGMQHDHVSGAAETLGPAIAECLYAVERQP